MNSVSYISDVATARIDIVFFSLVITEFNSVVISMFFFFLRYVTINRHVTIKG